MSPFGKRPVAQALSRIAGGLGLALILASCSSRTKVRVGRPRSPGERQPSPGERFRSPGQAAGRSRSP